MTGLVSIIWWLFSLKPYKRKVPKTFNNFSLNLWNFLNTLQFYIHVFLNDFVDLVLVLHISFSILRHINVNFSPATCNTIDYMAPHRWKRDSGHFASDLSGIRRCENTRVNFYSCLCNLKLYLSPCLCHKLVYECRKPYQRFVTERHIT